MKRRAMLAAGLLLMIGLICGNAKADEALMCTTQCSGNVCYTYCF